MEKYFMIILLVCSSIIFSQKNYQDVVHLKNGDIIKGVIIENVPNSYIRIELMGGSILTYKYEDISKFTKELVTNDVTEKEKTGNTIIMQQQQQQQQQQQPSAQPIQTPTNTGLTDAQKMALYESQKKDPTTAGVLSFFISSAGHAYAGNWGKGLLFLGGKIACVYIAANMTRGSTAQTIWLIYALLVAIWEIADAVGEVQRYNAKLYNNINSGLPNFGIHIIPYPSGAGLSLTYNF